MQQQSTTDNANFIHQVAYIYMSQSIKVMITIEGPRPGIDRVTSSIQGEHANHYHNGDRLGILAQKAPFQFQ